jgi:hypothetical protein
MRPARLVRPGASLGCALLVKRQDQKGRTLGQVWSAGHLHGFCHVVNLEWDGTGSRRPRRPGYLARGNDQVGGARGRTLIYELSRSPARSGALPGRFLRVGTRSRIQV